MSLTTKKAYVESYGAGRAELVEKEVQRLVESGYAIRSGTDFDLTRREGTVEEADDGMQEV